VKGFIKKKTTRIVGITTVLVLALIIGTVTALATTKAPTAQAVHSPLSVAVYIGNGANSDKVVATLRACQACGFNFYGISLDDINMGRLTTTNYDVLLLPDGCDSSTQWYASSYGFTTAEKTSITSFISGGGGMVGLGTGAQYMSSGTGNLAVFNTAYTKSGGAGKNTMTYKNANFGTVNSTQQLYWAAGGGYWAALPTGGIQGGTTSPSYTVLAGCPYGSSGHVAVCSAEPELRGDSELDWSIWDNYAMSSTQTNSAGGWSLIGAMVKYAATGTGGQPTLTTYANPTGSRVAIYSTYTYANGGAFSGLLPGISRAVENAGDVPLAITADYIKSSPSKLLLANFKVLVCPGGYSSGYMASLGTAGGTAIKNFATSGGGVMGICAGSYYLCASIVYDGTTITELGLYAGQGKGELTDIATYPGGALTPIATNDTGGLGNLGTLQIYYAGGPYFPTPLSSSAHTVSTYAYTGTYSGDTSAIRFMYGSGHVLMSGPHPEVRNGSNVDWMTWDNYVKGSNTPLNNSTNPWLFFTPALTNWLDSTI
jgi:glutamine amidotransferase-like uncharacterized protein